MAAIRSFEEPLVLLAGGRDKNLPWDDFAQLVRQRVEHVVLFGEAAQKIAAVLGPGAAVTLCGNLEQAVASAARVVKPGNVVLLAPGGTSFDEFKDFEERGECFRRLVMQL
jgi:UDP-N-acetylmuramoylalanine--D-glutamate ligase